MDRRRSLEADEGAGLRVCVPRRQHDDLDDSSRGPCRRRGSGEEREGRGRPMRTTLRVVVAAAGLVLAAVPVRAHHAFAAEFDQNKPIKVQGAVTKWELTNPHSWIYIDVKGDDGKMTTWMI